MQQHRRVLTLILVGDSGVGKTTLVTRLQEKELQDSLPIYFNILDVPGKASWDYHGIQADCAIIMFDVTSTRSYKNAPAWAERLRQQFGTMPTVLVGNKIDDVRKTRVRSVTLHRRRGIEYHAVSSRTGYNLEAPFLYLAAQLAIHNSTADDGIEAARVKSTGRVLSRLELLPAELIDIIFDNVLDPQLASRGVSMCEYEGYNEFPPLLTTCRLLSSRTLDWYYRHEINIAARLWSGCRNGSFYAEPKPKREYNGQDLPVGLLKKARNVRIDTSGLWYRDLSAPHPVVNQIAGILADSEHLTTLSIFGPPHYAMLPEIKLEPAIEKLLGPLLCIKSPQVDVRWGGVRLDLTDFNAQIGLHCYNAVLEATTAGNVELVRFIAGHSHVDLNTIDDSDRTALHIAISSNNVEIVDCLLATGRVDVNAPDMHDTTPLDLAVQYGNQSVVRLLLRQCFRSLDIDIRQYRTLCETYDFLQTDLLDGQTINTIAANIKAGKQDTELEYRGNKTLARKSAFQLVYLMFRAKLDGSEKDRDQLFNTVLYVVSHPGTFTCKARCVVREVYDDLLRPSWKQMDRLNEWATDADDGEDDRTTASEDYGEYDSDDSYFGSGSS